jgi:hydroxyethylthiazole kinase-like uncharacterized protein yjeF
MFLYTPKSVYAMDKAAVSSDGLAEIELMQRAGARVWCEITERWPALSKITVFAGSGNNGGDGFVVANLARQNGVGVQFLSKGDLTKQSATSVHYRDIWQQSGGVVENWQGQAIEGEVIVDGLLGIGLARELDEDWQTLIAAINQSDAPKVAIDIPSGLNAETGIAKPCAVEATFTVTFIGRKVGQVLADGSDYCGELIYDDLGISSATSFSQTPALEVIGESNLNLPNKRKHNSHKYSFGHVLVIGGDRGMVGAASLAAQAALRMGAGMVTVLVHPDCVHSLSATPELMVQSWHDLDDKLASVSVIVVGPGLGQSDQAKTCLAKLSNFEKPMVVDASALTVEFIKSLSSKKVVITPHPGEAAKLLAVNNRDVQADRLQASQQLSQQFSAVSVLKGSGSIVRQPDDSVPAINLRGNPGMASAGMGDVLAGMIGALLGQHLSAFDAAKTAVYIHARCAEVFALEEDESGLIASDIIRLIPKLVKQLRHA